MIRRARPGDVPAILDLVRELAAYERSAHEVVADEAELTAALFAPSPMTWSPSVFAHVAVDGATREGEGEVVGFALWFLSFSTWLGRHGIWLEDLFVRPAARGRGLGRGLLAALAAEAVARRLGRVEWWVLDWNEPALGFYRRLGATPMAEWTTYRLEGTALADLAHTGEGAPGGDAIA